MHKQNPSTIHKDLKPENILITQGKNGRFIKIGDFGTSIFHFSSSQTYTSDVGTPKFMAPEVIYENKYDTKADIHSLGVISQYNFDIGDET